MGSVVPLEFEVFRPVGSTERVECHVVSCLVVSRWYWRSMAWRIVAQRSVA